MDLAMWAEHEFQREAIIDVSAAVVGIARERWHSSSDGAEAEALIRKHSFEVIPVDDGGPVTEFFSRADDGSVVRRQIAHTDVVPYATSIREVIRRLAVEDRSFLFLESDHRIVGLISLSNLNCRQVKVWLFGLLSDLEVRLARLADSSLGSDRIREMLNDRKQSCTAKSALKAYQRGSEAGEVSIVQYMHLSDLLRVVKKARLHKAIGYSRKHFEELESLVDLRNAVAHPTNYLVSAKHPVTKLWCRVDRAEEALFRLQQWAESPSAAEQLSIPASGPLV